MQLYHYFFKMSKPSKFVSVVPASAYVSSFKTPSLPSLPSFASSSKMQEKLSQAEDNLYQVQLELLHTMNMSDEWIKKEQDAQKAVDKAKKALSKLK